MVGVGVLKTVKGWGKLHRASRLQERQEEGQGEVVRVKLKLTANLLIRHCSLTSCSYQSF